MRGSCLIPVFLMLAASPALAEIGPDAVLEDAGDCRLQAEEDWIACLSGAGAAQAAIEAAEAILAPSAFGMAGHLVAFEERGRVDQGLVMLPGMANTNEQPAFLNGALPVMSAGPILDSAPPEDSVARALRAAYPEAVPDGRLAIIAHRLLPDGRQRFVVTDNLVDGCRACAVIGQRIAHVEFRDGALVATRVTAWAPLNGAAPATDLAALQTALLLAGYDAGAPDGVTGPRTRSALAAFRAEHCLPALDGLLAAEEPLLLAANRDGTVPPCASTDESARLRFPYPDGRYVADIRLCAPYDDPVWQEFGDRAYPMVIEVEGAGIAGGETRCTVTAVLGADVSLACASEGEPFLAIRRYDPVDATAFAYEGQTFRRCPDPLD